MHPARRAVPVAVLAILITSLLLVAPLATAGSAEDPEITDPEGDQAITGGGPMQDTLDPDDFEDVDIVAAWINETDMESFIITVRSAAAVEDDTRTLIHFNVTLGLASVFGSTASGEEFTIDLLGSTVESGPDNVTAASDGADLTVTIPRASVGASGGDLVGGFFVERSRSTEETVPVLAPGEDAVDRAPDAGFGREYPLSRPPIVPGAGLSITGGTVQTSDGPATFTGSQATVDTSDATVTFNVRITNTGSDVDTYTLTATVTGPATAGVANPSFTLDPGANGQTTVQLTLTDADGTVSLTVNAASARGATASTAGTVIVAAAGVGDDGEGGLFESFPGNLPDWLWILIFVILLLLVLLLIILLFARRRNDEEEEETVLVEEDYEDNPLAEGLSPEDIAHARRLFEERESRYRDYAYPARDRSLDPDLPPEPSSKTRHFHPDGTECFHPPSIWADQGHAKPLRRLRGRDN